MKSMSCLIDKYFLTYMSVAGSASEHIVRKLKSWRPPLPSEACRGGVSSIDLCDNPLKNTPAPHFACAKAKIYYCRLQRGNGSQ